MSIYKTSVFGKRTDIEPLDPQARSTEMLQRSQQLFGGDSGTVIMPPPGLRPPTQQIGVAQQEDPIVQARRAEVLRRTQYLGGGDIAGSPPALPPTMRLDVEPTAPPPSRRPTEQLPDLRAVTLQRFAMPPPPGGTRVIELPPRRDILSNPFETLENPYGTPSAPFQSQVFGERQIAANVDDDLDDDIRELETKLSKLYITQRAFASSRSVPLADKRAIQTDIIKVSTDVDALRRRRQQRSRTSTPIGGSRTPSRPTTPQRRSAIDANKELAREQELLRQRRRPLAPPTTGGAKVLTGAELEFLSKVQFVLSRFRQQIQDELDDDDYEYDEEEQQARLAVHYIDNLLATYKKLNVPAILRDYAGLLIADKEFRESFLSYIRDLENALEEQVEAGSAPEDTLDGWRAEIIGRFENDVDQYAIEPASGFGVGIVGAFQGLRNWLQSLAATTPTIKVEQAAAAQGLEETTQAANAIATPIASMVDRQARRAAVDVRAASLNTLESAIVAGRAREMQKGLQRAKQLDIPDDAAQRSLGAALESGDPLRIGRARRDVARASADQKINQDDLDMLNDKQINDAARLRQEQAALAANKRRDAAELNFTAKTLEKMPRAIADVAQNAQDENNRIEALNTSLEVYVPNTVARLPFYSVRRRVATANPSTFQKYFQETFRDAPVGMFQAVDQKDGTSLFTINRLGAATAHTLIQLLFADLLEEWTVGKITTEGVSTKAWTQTLVPFLARIIRSATEAENDEGVRNEHTIAFWNEMRRSVSWLFCLGITGATAPPTIVADVERSQYYQKPPHAASRSVFTALGIDFSANRVLAEAGNLTTNQLLSSDKNAYDNATSPFLRMLESMPAFAIDANSQMRDYISLVFGLPLFSALYEKELGEVAKLPNYEFVDDIVGVVWQKQYGILGRFFDDDIYAKPGPVYIVFEPNLLLEDAEGGAVPLIDDVRAATTESLTEGTTIAAPGEVYTQNGFNDYEEDFLLAIVARELAAFALFVMKTTIVPLNTKMHAIYTIVGITMFAPFRIVKDDANDNASLWARFGRRPNRVVKYGNGERAEYVKTAGKARTTQRSQFRPSWFPVRFGGQSTKLLGELISKSTLTELSAFRRELAKDPRLGSLLNDEDNGYEITVLVPSTEALSNRAVQALLRDAQDSLDLFDYHVLNDLLDLPEMSKRGQKMHTVQTEYEQLPVKFSVNPGFTADHGGSLTLGENTSVFGDGKTVQVIAGPFRAKNGVFYVINSVLDHKKALRELGRIQTQPTRVMGQLPPPPPSIARNLPPPISASSLEEQYDFPLAPNGPFLSSAKADYIAGRIAIAPDRQQQQKMTSAKNKQQFHGKRLFGSVHETRKQELVMKNSGRTRARHSMKSRGRRAAQHFGADDAAAKQHERSLLALRMLLQATGVDKKIYAIEQAGRRPIVILAPTKEILDGIDFSTLSYEEQVAIVQQHVLFVNWRGEEATDDDLLTPTALESLFKNDVSKTSFETFNGRRAPNVEIVPNTRTNEEATPGANVLCCKDFEKPLAKIVYQDGVPGKPRFPTYVYFISKLLVPTSYGESGDKTITTSAKKKFGQSLSTPASSEFIADHTDTERIVRNARDAREAIDAINALRTKANQKYRYLSGVSRNDWNRLVRELNDAVWANRFLVGEDLRKVQDAIRTLGQQYDRQPVDGQQQSMQTNARQFISLFVDYQKDAVRLIQHARTVAEALDAVRKLGNSIYEQNHYLVSITRDNWALLIRELIDAVEANSLLSSSEQMRVKDEIWLLSNRYDSQPRSNAVESTQTGARQFISLFVDYQKDAVRLIQRARTVAEALDAVRQLINSIYERNHYLVSITRDNWLRMIDELREAVDVNAMLSDIDRARVKDEIALLSTYYNEQPRDDLNVVNIRLPLEDVDLMAARERERTTRYLDRDGDGVVDTIVRTSSKPQQQQQKTTSAHASPAKPPLYELPRDAKVHAQEWLTEFDRATGIMGRTNDFDKFSTQLEQLNARLDRLGGAKTVETEADRERLMRIFENMESAIARNRHIDVSYKDDAREALYKLQQRFGL